VERNVDLMEISDGKIYGLNDMVKACAGNCAGCSACCHGRGDTVTLDPLDVHHLKKGLCLSFEQLLQRGISLSVVEGVIRPSIMMTDEEDSKCVFLNEQGRCRIHSFRPGLCRLFPLGRVYQENGLGYILLTGECVRENRTKVKVRKWIDMPDMPAYEDFLCKWHAYLKDLQQVFFESNDDAFLKNMNMYVLQKFYVEDFAAEVFYEKLKEKLDEARRLF